MLLPATHFYAFSLPPKLSSHHYSSFSSSSSSFIFPIPISKTLIPRSPRIPKFIVRSSASASDTQTLPKSAIQRIADKLRSLGYTEETQTPSPECESTQSKSAGEIFVPLPQQLPKYRIGHTIDSSWSTPENPVPKPGTGTAVVRYNELTSEVKKQKTLERRELGRDNKREEEKVPTLAELSLSHGEMRRLTTLGIRMKQKLKIGKAGLTEGIVNGIHERWRRSEVVKLFCEDISRLNMKRTHELLERKTGGLVVWRSGSKIILYRGTDYKFPYFLADKVSRDDNLGDALQHSIENQSSSINSEIYAGQRSDNLTEKPSLIQGVGSPDKVRFQLPGEAALADEADHLLMGLGPRFTDWWGYDPLPVDADLLPGVIPGYRKPFRLLPYGVSPKLTNDEMTTLRRLGKPLPCHFALGRNRNLQGLAAAIVKLWERCEIAKIAIKRGVQNTNSEMMTEELKLLTGATLLARDKEFIVLYRGKDFLPSAVSSAIEERRNNAIHREKLKVENSSSVTTTAELKHGNIEYELDDNNDIPRLREAAISEERRMTEAAIKRTRMKLSTALENKAKAEKLLAELEKAQKPQEQEIDKEGITGEERYMLRKIGLKMKPFLLLGRRGVFDGTVENMHLHWKYRELVKIICKVGTLKDVDQIAQMLEAESGGILVAVERVSKGYAIIVYRGKNYSRPARLRPQTLLNKKEALRRSIEAQRRESLKLHVLKLNKNIDELKCQLVKDKEANDKQKTDVSRFESVKEEVKGTESIKLSGPTTTPKFDALPSTVPASRGKRRELDGLNGSVVENMQSVSNDDAIESFVPSAPAIDKKSSIELPSRSVYLSNKERLLLRKQALKMKKRPVLAVGKSNIVTGLAKTIKAHFQKHPLAIVNVKGRAKGTSVQEVVFKLEQATGAVLVSQEPSKVILYRGWGAEEKPGMNVKNKMGKEGVRAKPIVSPELLEAIRIECGLK